ncbi:Retinoblastoma-like protein 1 [Stylosanthes scabra]|uniref:RHOMBOID-like protein n=1 Tax=Stylosanthes scabra TaxID=79078 RepID=A0ABU6SC04_9FABA|nr:Retinoblastoma-like protein 1 [Stylosanthes scabra]
MIAETPSSSSSATATATATTTSLNFRHTASADNSNTIARAPVARDPPRAIQPPDHEARHFHPFKRWFPWLVPSFVVANVVLFIATMYVNDCPKHYVVGGSCFAPFLGRFSFQPLKQNPLFGPSSSTLEKMGALKVDEVVHRHQAWRLFSCMWLHGGVIHLLANMLSLVFIGIRLEQEFGFVRIGLLYVISGFGGSLLSALFINSGISVGASGALFGLLGGMLSELLTNWTIYANKFAAMVTLLVIIVINLAVGILPHVDNFAHIGGFISGFLVGFVFLIRPHYKWVSQRNSRSGYAHPPTNSKHNPYQYVLWIVSFILLSTGLITGLVLLLRGVNLNDHCSWCRYLSCFPTAKWSCKPQEVYCESTRIRNQLNMTCLSNGRNHVFTVPKSGSLQAESLCSQLCSR